MKNRIRLAAVVAISALTTGASADEALLTGITYDVTGQDEVTIQVLATGSLDAPRIRTQRGQIRVWFPNIENNPRVRIPGDGEVFSELGLRPGVADTGVLDIGLVHRPRLSRSDVRFERNEMGGVLRLARGDVAPIVAPEEVSEPEPETATEPDAAPAMGATDSETETDSEAEATESELESAQDSEAAEATDGESGTPLFGNRDEAEEVAPALGSAGGGANMGLLVLISLLLGGVYLFVRAMSKGKKIAIDDDINIVATKRLGPRYQLVLVRALGQDHLIAMHRGQTQLLSSTPTEEMGGGVEPGMSIIDRLREKADSDTVQLSSEASEGDKFGAKLLSLTAIRKRIEEASRDESEPGNGESDAVAGLMRLRRAAGLK